MLFDLLVRSLGQLTDGQTDARQAELRLAAACLLYAVIPADRHIRAIECKTLLRELANLTGLDEQACLKLFRRAAAAHNADPSIFAAATFLKTQAPLPLRKRISRSAMKIARADKELHAYEADILQRIERLLGVGPTTQTARQHAA